MILQLENISRDELQSLISEGIAKALQDYTPTTTPPPDERLLNTAETALLLKVTELTLLNWRKSGKLPAIKIGGRYYYKYSEIVGRGKQDGSHE